MTRYFPMGTIVHVHNMCGEWSVSSTDATGHCTLRPHDAAAREHGLNTITRRPSECYRTHEDWTGGNEPPLGHGTCDKVAPRLWAALLVRDSSETIVSALNSVAAVGVTGVIVHDTGSVDDTCKLIWQRCRELNLTCLTVRTSWSNFGINRTRLWSYIQEVTKPDDYVLLLDSDETVEGALNLDELTQADVWNIAYAGATRYTLPRLLKSSVQGHWEGAVHEWLQLDAPATQRTLGGLKTVHHGGHSPADDERDIKYLEGEPPTARNLGYLGRAHLNLGHTTEALQAFDAALETSTWPEERHWLRLQLGGCYAALGDHGAALHEWLSGYEKLPTRLECLTRACQQLRLDGLPRTAMGLWQASLATSPRPPEDHVLFVELPCWEYLREYEMSICSWYAESPADSYVRGQALLNTPGLPEWLREAVELNLDRAITTRPNVPVVDEDDDVE